MLWRLVSSAAGSLWVAVQLLILSGSVFALVAVVLKGDQAIAAARHAARELRLNLKLYFFDALFIAPVIALLVQLVREGVARLNLALIDESWWTGPGWVIFAAVVFVGDFCSYWRHRLEHTRWLWPAHAIHHSDTQMTWLTLVRFHPVNRVTTAAVDITCLALLGFPAWALVANELVRHYYGEFIHAGVPWTYGPLKGLIVSPAMHRWHHARDVVGSGSNFATVFAVFDRAFGTWYVPGPCNVPLGVTDDLGSSMTSQLLYPFAAWGRALRRPPA